MHWFPALITLCLLLLIFAAPFAANHLHRRHHDHLIPGHPRSPR
ncbi:MAG: hypothetical protein WBL20_17555 [Sphingobium sp.]